MVSGNNWCFLFIYADFQSLWWLTTKGDGSYIFFTDVIINLLQLESPSKWKDSKLSGKKPCGRESRFKFKMNSINLTESNGNEMQYIITGHVLREWRRRSSCGAGGLINGQEI